MHTKCTLKSNITLESSIFIPKISITFIICLLLCPPLGASRCLTQRRSQIVWDHFERWLERNPLVAIDKVSERRDLVEDYIKVNKCPSEAEFLSESQTELRDTIAPKTTVAFEGNRIDELSSIAPPSTPALPNPISPPSPISQPPSAPPASPPPRSFSESDNILDLARCLTTVTSKPIADACRTDFDPEAPALHSVGPSSALRVLEASATSVKLMVKVQEALPDAVFFTRVTGPSTLQAADYFHVNGDHFAFNFTPVEPGLHRVEVRLEYASSAEALAEQSLPPATYLALPLADSPFQVEVPNEKHAAFPVFTDLPICQSADQSGVWRNINQNHQKQDDNHRQKEEEEAEEKIFRPELSTASCPRCLYINASDTPKKCEPLRAKRRLQDRGADEWHTWDRYAGRKCRYCRYSRLEALKCLDNKRIIVAGDSVHMQLCSYLQCAHAGLDVPTCELACTHRMNPHAAVVPQEERYCYEKQPGMGPFYCVSFDNLLGEPLVGGDRGAFLLRKYTAEESLKWLQEARARATLAVPGESRQDVLVIGAGLHDVAFGRVTFQTDIQEKQQNMFPKLFDVILNAGFSEIVWIMPTAIHRHVSWKTNCSDYKQILNPTCMQYAQLHMTNSRVREVHSLIRLALAQAQAKYPHAPPVKIIDAYAMSETREDITMGHSDMVHYCDEFNREHTQVLLHTLCRC